MKKLFLILVIAFTAASAFAQNCYWVFFADKQGTTFDPYAYFDAKAVERYQQCGADLYDITNYPLNESYVRQVGSLVIEEVGSSRWLNAVAVMATPDQVVRIEALPFVLRTQALAENMQLTQCPPAPQPSNAPCSAPESPIVPSSATLSQNPAQSQPLLADQLLRMGGDLFREKGLDGTGMRIAVLDGGFPRVDTHFAFKHLRDNHRILDTWNFPNKKADVYGWNSHGLSTLSCITGIVGGLQIGLATGAEFLLYRTEVNTEPYKEEVWWQMAMERADQHGANIISSSLGYGKERHYTYEMDGRSYVAKAALTAARKGILVCNSAGNEGGSKQWKTIITPADADSVLCVGGIESSLRDYSHISFSSYGPAADGRLKPDVAAYGHALAAVKKGDEAVDWVYGTSFSCPLTAGFVACAWQAMRDKTAMQMLREVQQSGDLYPYFDYALGYGVPQASHFAGVKDDKTPIFRLVETQDSVEVRFVENKSAVTVFYNKQDAHGHLVKYDCQHYDYVDANTCIGFHKGAIGDCRLNVWVDGCTQSYQGTARPQDTAQYYFYGYPLGEDGNIPRTRYERNDDKLKPAKWGSDAKFGGDVYFTLGNILRTQDEECAIEGWSPAERIGFRLMRAFGKSYRLGLGFEYSINWYRFAADQTSRLDRLYGVGNQGIEDKHYQYKEFSIEFFQRVRFVPCGLMGNGFHWDLGAYVGFGNYDYVVRYNELSYAEQAKFTYHNPSYVDNSRVNFGLTTRLTYDFIGIYARYRLTHFATCWNLDQSSPTAFLMRLPRLEVGVQICL